MNIGVVTSFYNGYDRFMPRWVRSVCMQYVKPDWVVLVASGPVQSEENLQIAEELIRESDIQHTIVRIPEHKTMGFARNIAVMLCPTEWVMYLDADDEVLPNGIRDVQKYEHLTDVICTGLKVVGDRRNKINMYTSASRERQVQGKYCSCSHSPFRKCFWEKAPFIETNDYCEQALWLGLAQAGARMMGTKEVCTVYNTRRDGHNMSMTKEQWAECKAQRKRFLKEGVQYD